MSEKKTETTAIEKTATGLEMKVGDGTVQTIPSAALNASLHNDWSKVNDADKLRYVVGICKALNIPTPLNPFRFIKLNGREVLYAGAETAQLLAERNNLSVPVMKRYTEKETNIHVVEARAIQKDGRYTDEIGAIYIGGKSGDQLANAMMKAITKAKRRAVLSFCGLSALDEDEIEAMNKNTAATGFQPSTGSYTALLEDKKQNGDVENWPTEEDELKAMKTELFTALVGKGGMFEKKPAEANAWILETVGVPFEKLTLNDVQELFASFQDEQDPIDVNQLTDEQRQMDLVK